MLRSDKPPLEDTMPDEAESSPADSSGPQEDEPTLADVQNQRDHRLIDIDRVGVKNLQFPITVLDREHGVQHTVADISMAVNLPHHYKGTHMSRFLELLNEQSEPITVRSIPLLLKQLKERLDAESAHLEIAFPYFLRKKAPVSGSPGMVAYRCRFLGSATNRVDIGVQVCVPVTTLCPCSKEIADRGAHNQRGEVKVAVRFKKMVWIEDLIALVESAASCELYSVLKRVDEKYVTERAYDHPVFVEDLVRAVADRLMTDDNITYFSVQAENHESIHPHDVFAIVERDKRRASNDSP